MSLPLRHRPIDLALGFFFAISVIYGLLFSLPEGLGVPVSADSPWPPLRSLYGWAVAQEAAHLDPPAVLRASTIFDGFAQSPFLVVLLYSMVRGRDWIRRPALVYSGAAVVNMFFYFFTTFMGEHPPPNLGTYLAFNLPWLFAPIVLGARMWRREPFSRAAF